jgi:tetratricopeptide (TPR) repeat protein
MATSDEQLAASNDDTAEANDPKLAEAIAEVEKTPESGDAWDALEQLADERDRPDEVAAAYRKILARGLSKEVAEEVADRAVRFYQAWYIDTPEETTAVLSTIVERYPDMEWAFEKLVVELSSAAKWDELLGQYDSALGATRDEKKRRKLLDDAARLAKDFADQPDRAADYLQQLLALEPDNDKLVHALERLLERGERWNDLLGLWRDQLPRLSSEDARATRVKIAACSLDKLGAPQQALAELRGLVEENPGHSEACDYLERILASEEAAPEARRESLSLLRKTYEIVERPEDVVRVLQSALDFVSDDDRRSMRRESGSRLAILGRDEEAISHFAALLRDDPGDADARKQIRQLARRSDRRDLHAQALVDAAAAAAEGPQQVALWREAAELKHDALNDTDGAIELYSQVLHSEHADPSDALSAAHQLNQLFAKAERSEDRLAVLERLAALERAPAIRRQIAAEAARLAEELGNTDRALAGWEQLLADTPADAEALSARIELLDRGERWSDLVEALRGRAAHPIDDQSKRADLMRIAKIQGDKLELVDEPIETWMGIREDFGENAEVLEALDALMSAAGRWPALAELLDDAVRRERNDTATRIVRLAGIYADHLEQPDFAAPLFAQALVLDPGDGGARDGMTTLLEVPSCAHVAAEALARAYDKTDEWQSTLELLEPRLSLIEDAAERAELLREAAVLREQRAEDPKAAMTAMARALPLDAKRRDLRRELMRLAELAGSWEEAATALSAAATALSEATPDGAAELHGMAGEVHETKLDDWASAFESYRSASTLVPDDIASVQAVARCAARAGRWQEAAAATVSTVIARGRIDAALVNALEAAAEAIPAWRELADALGATVEQQAKELPDDLACALNSRVASWYQEHCDDPEAAAPFAARAVALDASNPAALKTLAALQRREPGPELVDTLLRMDDAADDDSLDGLHEAATVAGDSTDDVELARKALNRLFRKAVDLWIDNKEASGEKQPAAMALWALDALVESLLKTNDRARAARLLLEGADLPVSTERSAELSRRAAEILVEMGKRVQAIDAYRRSLAAAPDALEVVRTLAGLNESEEQQSGSVALRERELSLVDDLDERLTLRLANAERAAALERRGGRAESLLANLKEAVGHRASVEALATLFSERGQSDRLCGVLEEQAGLLSDSDAARASELYSQAAEVAEKQLADRQRAIGSLEKVASLSESVGALDSLARLHGELEEYPKAADWLAKRLEGTAAKQRVAVMLRLARARIRADQTDEAIATLTTGFGEAPQNAEVRKLLIKQLRGAEKYGALADTLSAAVEHASDDATVLAYAREAADLYYDRLDKPEQAVPVLRKAVAMAPDDRKLRGMLGDGLRAAGELDEARELLTKLIEDYGRRGSKERAAVHVLLAKVLREQGETNDALAQLETASKMDADDLTILSTLADMSRKADDLARAERALRTMLLTARRLEGKDVELPIGTSEVLFELSSLALARGQRDQAEELAESAIESLAGNDAQAPRLQAKLKEQGDHELLLRLLDARLGYLRSPYRRGVVLGEKAAALLALERNEDALGVKLEAVDIDPGSPMIHDGLRELANEVGKLDDYVAKLEGVLGKATRDSDAMIRCEVLMRLADIAANVREDYAKASELLEQAAETGVREVDVLRAHARVAGARGDEEEQMRLLNQLASLGEDQVETRAGALYRMAEVQLNNDETLDDGIESLQKALADSPRWERAGNILRRSTEQHSDHEQLLDVYEQVARKSEDDRTLMDYLEKRANHAEASTDHVREAVAKAMAMEDTPRAQKLMLRAVDIGRAGADGMYSVDWALLGLAQAAKLAGNLDEAVKWLDEAVGVAEPSSIFALGRELADMAAAEGGDQKIAAQLYERLREGDPMAREAWEPLVELYRELGDLEALERVVTETLDGLVDVGDRNALRLVLARGLLGDASRADDVVAAPGEDRPGG